jgi:proteic killer suppression protein
LEIAFRTKRLQKLCNDSKFAVQRLGPKQAARLRRRLDDLKAVVTLDEMRNLPGRCHELTGNRSHTLSLDLEHPNRLLFVPLDDPPPTRQDGGLDWKAIEAIQITAIEDTHG